MKAIKVKFIGKKGQDYALFENKIYYPYYESEENYLLVNEVGGNAIVPKDNFEIISLTGGE